jgi:hypothetical protein
MHHPRYLMITDLPAAVLCYIPRLLDRAARAIRSQFGCVIVLIEARVDGVFRSFTFDVVSYRKYRGDTCTECPLRRVCVIGGIVVITRYALSGADGDSHPRITRTVGKLVLKRVHRPDLLCGALFGSLKTAFLPRVRRRNPRQNTSRLHLFNKVIVQLGVHGLWLRSAKERRKQKQ